LTCTAAASLSIAWLFKEVVDVGALNDLAKIFGHAIEHRSGLIIGVHVFVAYGGDGSHAVDEPRHEESEQRQDCN